MADQDNRAPLLPISGILALLAVVGVVAFTPKPFKDGRPPVAVSSESADKVPARLWQDPFRAVLDFEKIIKKPQGTDQETNAGKTDKEKTAADPFEKLHADIKGIPSGDLTVLGVMVEGGAYSEDEEWRLRTRYAVLAGLERLRYEPQDESHIEYVIFDPKLNKPGDARKAGPVSLSNIVPYEWVKHSAGKKTVLLLWLNDNAFQENGTPLKNIAALIHEVLQVEQKDKQEAVPATVNIIGPAGSTNLVNMIKELKDWAVDKETEPDIDMAIYSAMATADTPLVAKAAGINEDKVNNIINNRIKFKQSGKVVYLERTIGQDEGLAKKIIDELCLRDVNAKAPECNNRDKEHKDHKDHIVLISEWDTFYGRSLQSSFERAWGVSSQDAKHEWLHRFGYLRGLDGIVPGEQVKNADNQNENGDKKSTGTTDVQHLEQPTGKSQYDYLRRLADSISLLEVDLKQKDKRARIRAIGILGSDFYDKYLMLQALRERFPEAVYFTTDLDARMTHPDNFKWMRNVIVASNYNLTLHPTIQSEIPPFRSNYQTAVFLAVLKAFAGDKNDHGNNGVKLNLPDCAIRYQEVGPRIFEIGRSRAFDLTDDRNLDDYQDNSCPVTQQTNNEMSSPITVPLHPKRYHFDSYIFGGLGLISIAVTVILLSATSIKFRRPVILFVTSPKKYLYWSALILAALAVTTVYMLVIGDPREEPFSYRGGISIWPAVIIRLSALILSVYFFSYILKRLRDSNNDLAEACCLPNDSRVKFKPLKGGKFKYWKDTWRGSVCNMYNWEEKIVQESTIEVGDLWSIYLCRSRSRERMMRILVMISFFFLLGFLIILLLGGVPVSPVRGPLSMRLNIIILMGSVLTFLCLTFLVVDETSTCTWFINNASKKRDLKWPDVQDNDRGQAKREWLLIHLIAARTEVVGKFIFYPFIILMLMIVARSDYFDNWATPWQLALIISLTAVYAWTCAIKLRGAAERARTAALDRLSRQLADTYSHPSPKQELVKQIEHVISEVKSIQRGTFAPFTHHPVVQALLVPFGGAGGMLLIEVMEKMNL